MQTTICDRCGWVRYGRSDKGCPGCKAPGKLQKQLRPIKLIGSAGDDQHVTEMFCRHGHIWTGTIYSAKKIGCPACAEEKRRTRNTVERLKIRAERAGLWYVSEEAVKDGEVAQYECKHCGEVSGMTPKHAEIGCQSCVFTRFVADEQSFFYVIMYSLGQRKYIGFGKTNTPEKVKKTISGLFFERGVFMLGEKYVPLGGDKAAAMEHRCVKLGAVETGIRGFNALPYERVGEFFRVVDVGAL